MYQFIQGNDSFNHCPENYQNSLLNEMIKTDGLMISNSFFHFQETYQRDARNFLNEIY